MEGEKLKKKKKKGQKSVPHNLAGDLGDKDIHNSIFEHDFLIFNFRVKKYITSEVSTVSTES